MENNKVIDVTSIFTSEQFFKEEEKRIEKLAETAKTALNTPIKDNATYKINHEAQMQLRDERIKWEKARKDFTSSLDEKKKFAIDRERSITCHIIPIEEELKAKKEAYDVEQERIKAEEEAQKTKVFQERINEMASYGYTTDLAALRDMSDEGFRMMADMYKKKWEEAEAIRKSEELEMLEKQEEAEKRRQAELEEQRKLKEENDKKALELTQREKAIKDAENEKARQEELKETAEKARQDERKRIENERIAKEQADLAEKARMEKETKYREWLALNGVTPDKKDNFKIEKIGDEVILWEKISVYKI